MKPLISFTEFIRLPKSVQESMGTFDNEYLQEELSPTAHKKKMVELERALKQKDWYWYMSDSGPDYKKGKSEEDKIKAMRDALGDDGNSLYKQYAVKSGVVNEGKKDMKPASEYEVFLQMKMREWEIKSLDELEKSLLRKFWNEVDAEWKGNTEVQVNMPEQNTSLFPEMSGVKGRTGGLDYADRKTGEKSLTASSFCDAGNLYQNQTPWQPPSKERMKNIK